MTEAGGVKNDADRRGSIRFPLRLAVTYRKLNPASSASSPLLETVNISSKGLLLEDSGALQPGQNVQVFVEWPVRLDQGIHLNLVLEGRILRRENGQAVLKIYRHEFRTRGSHYGTEVDT